MHPATPTQSPAAQPTRADGVVSDPRSGLQWSDTLGDSRLTFAQAEKACADLRLGGHADWRLPTVEELAGLIDYSRCEPAIDTALFPDTKTSWYWTASPVASHPDFAWIVYFNYGDVNDYHRDYLAWVRAVRGPRASQ